MVWFILGFIAGAFLTRQSVWKVIAGKAKFAVVPKGANEAKEDQPHKTGLHLIDVQARKEE